MRAIRYSVWFGLIVLALCSGCGILMPPRITETPADPLPEPVRAGQRAARQYLAGAIKDYELVWQLYDLQSEERTPFLDGFVDGFSEAGSPSRGTSCRVRLEEAIDGEQFRMGVALGIRHAAGIVTNEQTEELIRNSMKLSPGVSLGWKAGYIRGFSARCLTDLAARDVVTEARRAELQVEAAAAYHSLRATVDP